VRSRQTGTIFERPRKSGIYWIDYRDAGGERHRERVGRRDAALELLVQRKREVTEGKFIAPRAGARTFRELSHAALEHKKLRLAAQSYETDVRRLDTLLPLIGALSVEQVTFEVLDKTFADLKRGGLSGSTVNRYRALVSSIFTYAVRSGLAQTNPVARVKRFRENESRIRYLLADEETKLRAVIRRECPDREPELDLALYTGMRRGEQFTLKWSDVNLERGILTVRGKTGRRFIVANSSAVEALTKLGRRRDRELEYGRTEDSGYVCDETVNDAQRDWRRWFEKSVRSAGVKNFHWHDLRHTFASRLVMAGVDIRTVQELLGHKSILMTMKYAHLSPDHRQAAAEKIGGKNK
jgi:site-specific recombinase XerD